MSVNSLYSDKGIKIAKGWLGLNLFINQINSILTCWLVLYSSYDLAKQDLFVIYCTFVILY